MILYLSGRDTDDLLMALEGIKGVTVKRSQERKKRKYFEKGARKDSMGQASGTVFLANGMGTAASGQVRDILVAGLRAREVEIAVKDTGAAFAGPCGDEASISALAAALE